MKTGLVMEGGAMKGLFTCGVIDVMMERGLTFDGAIGVSAGAAFGCNYKSMQPGRPLRYNVKYVNDKRYASFWSLFNTGDFYGVDFCYHQIPEKLDIWDVETFRKNPMEFYCVATDCETGKAVYHKCDRGMDDIDWIRASASVPVVSRVVEIGNRKLVDGGISDPIPLRYFQWKGYEKNVVITTKPADYVDKLGKMEMAMMQIALHQYPNFIQCAKTSSARYNKTMRYLEEQEAAGKIFTIRPPEDLQIGATGKDEENIKRVYEMGRKAAKDCWNDMMRFLTKI